MSPARPTDKAGVSAGPQPVSLLLCEVPFGCPVDPAPSAEAAGASSDRPRHSGTGRFRV